MIFLFNKTNFLFYSPHKKINCNKERTGAFPGSTAGIRQLPFFSKKQTIITNTTTTTPRSQWHATADKVLVRKLQTILDNKQFLEFTLESEA